MEQQREVTVLIDCHDLPGICYGERTAIRLGIQKGPDVIDDVLAGGERVTFTATLRVTRLEDGRPNFLGPYAHGKPEGRFLYLVWGERGAESWDTFGRAKVPLAHLDWHHLDRSWETGEPIKISLALSDKQGGPKCGSVSVD